MIKIWFIILFLLNGILITCYLYSEYSRKQYIQELDQLRKTFFSTRNKLSMLEYHYRTYKEGKDAYTVLIKIGKILRDEKN